MGLKTEFAGSGGIFYSVDADELVHVMLAQEARFPVYRNSETWSGFEGGRKPKENEIDCALREMYEESLGLFGTGTERRRIAQGDYAMKVKMVLHHRRGVRVRTAFVFRIAHDPQLPREFQRRRDVLLQARAAFAAYHGAAKPRVAAALYPGGADCAQRPVLAITAARMTDDEIHVDYLHEGGAAVHAASFASSSACSVRQYHDAVQHLAHAWRVSQALPPDLIDRAIDFTGATVRPDFLEKQRVDLWSQRYLADLLALQQRTLRHSVLHFRDSFVPIMRTVLLHLRACTFLR
jgi:hypothetical protein